MSGELNDLLSALSDDIESTAPTLEAHRLQLLTSTVRRRRRARRTVESFAGVAAVSALTVGLWFGTSQHNPAPVTPVTTPTPSPTADATPSPATTPTPTPTATSTTPPSREADVDDATVLERLRHPRTGEVWQTPEPAPEIAAVLDGTSGETYFLVGTRGEAAIYIGVLPSFYGEDADVIGIYEVDSAGARLILCPSARTGDVCAQQRRLLPPTVIEDTATFYDTLTLPAAVGVGGGWTFTTTSTRQSEYAAYNPYGDGSALLGRRTVDQRVLRQLGPLALVAESVEGVIPGMANVSYGIRTPFGSTIALLAEGVPGATFGTIRWDTGSAPTPVDGSLTSASPGTESCYSRTFSQETSHVAADWRRAGTTAEGLAVYVPVEGGSELARTIRAWHSEHSWGYPEGIEEMVQGPEAGYRFPTDAAFLEANALYALQGPTGEWLLGLRFDARQHVWECV